MLNDYGMGGYLIFAGVKPFIDGRSDMYGDAFTEAYFGATAQDSENLVPLLTRYHVTWTLLDPGNPANRALDGLPGWKVLYRDRIAVVHVRAD